jgi:hypothetical protein
MRGVGLLALLGLSCSHPTTFQERDKLGGIAPSEVEFSDLKKKLMVTEFWNDSPVTLPEVQTLATQSMVNSMMQTRRILVMENAELKTKEFVHDNSVQLDQLMRTAKKVGAAAALLGKISRITFTRKTETVGFMAADQISCSILLEVKLIESQTGQELLSVDKEGSAFKPKYSDKDDQTYQQKDCVKLALTNATDALTKMIVPAFSKLTWQGQIVDIKGDIIYINSGQLTGLSVRDILKVQAPGEDIFDPVTGDLMGSSIGRMKGTLEIIGFSGPDLSAARLKTGGPVDRSDIVSLY